MPIFSVVDMGENALSAAYPLVRTAAPDVSADQWSDYAHKALMRGGLLGLMGPQDTLLGLLTYRHEENLRHGRTFVVDNFLTFELSRAAPGRQALCDAAEALAREQECKAIEVRLDSRGFAIDCSTKARSWLDRGHHLKAVVFTKVLPVNESDETAAASIAAREKSRYVEARNGGHSSNAV
jgi:hypothetical protein